MMMKSIRSVLMVSIIVTGFACTLSADAATPDTGIIETEESATMEETVESQSERIPDNETGESEAVDVPIKTTAQGTLEIGGEEPVTTGVMVGEQPQDTLVPDKSDESFKFPLYRAVGGLGLVLCLMIALYFGARKWFPQYFQKAASEQNLKILETVSMGDRRSIALIQVADKRFLIGNTSQQINLLTAITESIPLALAGNEAPELSRKEEMKDSDNSFKNLFEFEKKRPVPNNGNPLPEDIRNKMRLLREALER